ncbi:MAG: hypothetical protein Q8920_16875 [Bacillota bacterium]|nr:hypothetical protein [Bacillota bacterium]
MKRNKSFILKNLLVLILTLAAFPLASKLLGTEAGNMPQVIKDNYSESFFIRNGLKLPAIILLCTAIIIFMLINYHKIKDGIHGNRFAKGIIYGSSFGIVWLTGFVSMTVFFKPTDMSHFYSGIRDFCILTFFGLLAGWLLSNSSKTKIKRKPRTLLAIPLVAVFFAIMQGASFYYTFKPAHITISSFFDVVYLLLSGAWIGFMYYLFKPGLNFRKKYLGSVFFSFSVFGINWLLYNAFYNIFVNIPLWDLLASSLSGILGVFIGLVIYELVLERKDTSN